MFYRSQTQRSGQVQPFSFVLASGMKYPLTHNSNKELLFNVNTLMHYVKIKPFVRIQREANCLNSLQQQSKAKPQDTDSLKYADINRGGNK